MRLKQIIKIPSIQILLFLYSKGEVRHSDLARLIGSRGTLSLSLSDLLEDGLVQRRILDSKPIQSFYNLTDKGFSIAEELTKIKNIASG